MYTCVLIITTVTVGAGGGIPSGCECREGSGDGTSMVGCMADFGEDTAEHRRGGDGS